MVSIVKAEFERRLIEEGLTRIKKCLSMLSEKEVWHNQNKNTNSVGNLILHLSGNVTQYILSGIGDAEDLRVRDEEFDTTARISKDKLIAKIESTLHAANKTIQNIREEDLTKEIRVQGFSETTLSVIIHVIEHFSYHVGQITYYTKYIKDADTGYYEGLDLNITS
ncbi:MAG: DUF1572 family protein [Saprospiraceae bacterium]|nr:DUF1572 domain-containing protein [Bacteroidia bacterium]NNE13370.1 DUF1572 family protein [Saprospiraceae bacterium]NNL91081.1 DUF1572 family protein [Saprospiraceae bacterium]RZV56515.1 MAG: DUF1572 domain-containing protein [Flavobacteriaceae bacterium]